MEKTDPQLEPEESKWSPHTCLSSAQYMWHQPQSLPFLLLVPDCLTVRKAEKEKMKTSLVIQWIRIRLPMQETQVWSLIWEYPTYLGATKPVLLNYWAQTPGAHALQQEKPPQREAPTSQLAKIPPSKGDPAQPKINLKKRENDVMLGIAMCSFMILCSFLPSIPKLEMRETEFIHQVRYFY